MLETDNAPREFHPQIYDDGTVEYGLDHAKYFFDSLRLMATPKPKSSDYLEGSGLYAFAQEEVLSTNTEAGTIYLKVSTHGSQAIEYWLEAHDGEVTSLIHPPEPAASPFNTDDVHRGCDMTTGPHNCLNENETNYHGTLPRTNAEIVHFDPESRLITFAVTPNLIPHPLKHQEKDTLTLVSYKLMEDGSFTKSIQTFNFGTETIATNMAHHPYADTRDNPIEAFVIGDYVIDIATVAEEEGQEWMPEQLMGAIFHDADYISDSAEIMPILQLITWKFDIILTALRGLDPRRADIGLWTDSLEKYACLEFIENADMSFDPQNPENTFIEPNQSSLVAFNMKVVI